MIKKLAEHSLSKRKVTVVCFTVLLLALASIFDYSATLYLRENDWRAWSSLMDRSWFEGESFGGGDVPVIVFMAVIFAWALSFLRFSPKSLKRLRRYFSYIIVHGLLTAVVIHLLKGVMARPRPSDVFSGEIAFRSWFDLQSPELHGWGRGSFPSGHTANIASLVSLTYVIAHGLSAASRWVHLARIIVFCLIATMGLSRVMHGAHWLTDTIAAAAITWWLADAVFHRLLCLPMQRFPTEIHRPCLWEFRLFVMVLVGCLNLAAALFALRLLAHSLYVWGTLYLISALGVAYVLFRAISLWQESLFPSGRENLAPPLDPDSVGGPLLSTVACQDYPTYQ
jgi:membrane-associated PAP2 superfamily phosphatase